jgi:hypothetical protein
VAGCGQTGDSNAVAPDSATPPAVPESIPMGGSKSVTRFFVTSKGNGERWRSGRTRGC